MVSQFRIKSIITVPEEWLLQVCTVALLRYILHFFFKKHIVWHNKHVFFLSEETEAILTKHLLKTVCSDITNIVVNVLGHEHMLSNSEEEENFTPEVCIWSRKGCGGGVSVSVKGTYMYICIWERLLVGNVWPMQDWAYLRIIFWNTCITLKTEGYILIFIY